MRPPSRRPLRRLGLRLLDRRARRPGRPDLSRHRAHRRRAVRGGGPARADGPARPAAAPARPKVDYTLEVRRILDGCLPLAGSPAETYLRGRGLSDPASPDLLYHPDLTDYDGARGWPGMVAVPRTRRRRAGRRHPSHLPARRRLGARPRPARRCWARSADGAVRLFPIGADGHLGIAEGIETALSAQAIFGVPTWAALSADGMARWQWPAEVRRVTIFADAGDAGRQAAARLADRLNLADIPSEIVAPLHGDDFNDDLQRGAVAADYAPASPESGEPEVAEAASAPEGPSAPTAVSVVRRPGSRRRGADQSAGRDRARHAARPARARPARSAARAPGARADQEPGPASPCRCSTSRWPSCAGG